MLTLTQRTDPTPGQTNKQPQHIPVAIGFLSTAGEPLSLAHESDERGTHVLELTEAEQEFRFTGADEPPVPSILRGFSAPVILNYERSDAERALLLAHDTDAFNRWEAGRDLALATLDGILACGEILPLYADALATAVARGGDPAFLALLLATPNDATFADHIAKRGDTVDPDAVHKATRRLDRAVAEAGREVLLAAYEANTSDAQFSPDAASAGRRSLKNIALWRLNDLGTEEMRAKALAQFEAADNMTDSAAALAILVHTGGEEADRALDAFHARWKHDPLVLDKWLALQAGSPATDTVKRVKELRARGDIEWTNPNRFRSLVGAFAGNHARFHAADGSGYRFFADQIEWLDSLNPQTTARMATAFETWRRFDPDRQTLIRGEMIRLLERPTCSRDLFEILTRLLGE